MAVPYSTRQLVYERDDYTCYRCGRQVNPGRRKKRKVWVHATLDHIIPSSKGGSDELTNLRTCCKRCNERKSNKTPKLCDFLNPEDYERFVMSDAERKLREKAGDRADEIIADVRECPDYYVMEGGADGTFAHVRSGTSSGI